MGTTTMGVKLDDATRERIKSAATRIDRTPHWLIKQAILTILKSSKTTKRCRRSRPCWRAPPTRAKKAPCRRKSRTSHSSTSPNRFCRSR